MRRTRHVRYDDYMLEVLPPSPEGGRRAEAGRVRDYSIIVAGAEPAPRLAPPPAAPRSRRSWGTLLQPRPLLRGIGRRRIGRVDWRGWAVLALLVVGALCSLAGALALLGLMVWATAQGWLWLVEALR